MEHSFVLDNLEVSAKPLPPSIKIRRRKEKINQPDYYIKYEVEFFDVVKDCAKMIDNLVDVEERIRLSKRLNKIFVLRDKMLVMKLFRDIVMKPVKEMKYENLRN